MNPVTPKPSSERAPSPNYKWYVVGMLWFICFFNYADRQAISAIFPLLKKEFHFSKSELGMIGAAFTWVYALTAPFAGQVGDKWPRKAVILGGLYIWSAITGFTAVCSRVWHFVLVRGGEGLGETFYFPASMSLVSDYHAKDTRSRAMSFHQTSVYAGTIGGSALAGWIGQSYGWRWPFVIFATGGILLGVVLATFIREPRRNEAELLQSSGVDAHGIVDVPQVPMAQFLGELARTPTALILILAFFGANFVALVFLTWMPTFLNEKFHLDLAQAGFGATFYIQAASMAGAALGGLLADRWRQKRSGGRILVQAMGTLVGAPFIFLCGYTKDIWGLIGAMALFGLGKGLDPLKFWWASLYDVVSPSRRGTAVGLMNMIGWLGGGLGALTIGLLADRHVTMSVAISGTAGIYLVVTCLMLFAGFVLAPRDIQKSATV